jgi:multidrug efflux system outer membrane protein
MVKSARRTFWNCVVAVLLCSCAVGPNYKRPDLAPITPADWHWKPAEPQDALPKGEWWAVFHDPVLDQLESQAAVNNQDLRAALARLEQARAEARITRSQLYPELTLDPSAARQRSSGNLPTPIPVRVRSATFNTFNVPLDLSYEVDLWGKIRRSFESSRAQAQASLADYQNFQLSLAADVASEYFLVRSLDREIVTLRRTIQLRQDSVRILSDRFTIGTIPEIDLAEAKTDLATAKADLADTTRQRAETLHALALLCGRAASTFDVPEHAASISSPPLPPVVLPSALVERRPDIAKAERTLAAQNAQIGVARAAYFPVIRLTGQAGYLSAESDKLFSTDSRTWSIGPSVSLPIFTAGRTAADVRRARAVYEEALAQYREIVLTAFREVEDSLAQVTLRAQQASDQSEALASATKVWDLDRARYDAGVISYFELADAERLALQQERLAAQIQGQRFIASVHLIKALGGGWQEARAEFTRAQRSRETER